MSEIAALAQTTETEVRAYLKLAGAAGTAVNAPGSAAQALGGGAGAVDAPGALGRGGVDASGNVGGDV